MADERTRATELFRAVGARVRELRLGLHMTLDELSTASGVSRRMITMLESGESNASLGTLDKLAEALGCDFATLVAARPVAPLTPEPTAGAQVLWDDDMGSSARLLRTHAGARIVEIWDWELQPRARYDAEADPAGSEEVLIVHAGTLEVEVGDDRYKMSAGDYLRLPSDVPYSYVSTGRGAARFVKIILVA